jgi:uncharacterized damage-inducible protein DinB
MLPLKPATTGDLIHELSNTRLMLERVPDEHFDWTPHEKSMSLGQLAGHIANILQWQAMILRQDEVDLAAPPPQQDAPETRADLLELFDARVDALKQTLDALDPDALARPWTLRHGERIIMEQPRAAMLRSMGISHMIHHRGQLSVYLRLLEVPVPGVYGPSADDEGGF